jgi:hypothetical protein
MMPSTISVACWGSSRAWPSTWARSLTGKLCYCAKQDSRFWIEFLNVSTDVSGKTKHWIICTTTWRNSTPGRRELTRVRVRSSPNRRPTLALFAAMEEKHGDGLTGIVFWLPVDPVLFSSYVVTCLALLGVHFLKINCSSPWWMLYAVSIDVCMSRGRNYILVDSIRIFITTIDVAGTMTPPGYQLRVI